MSFTTTKSPRPITTTRGYGCQREVYHPLSKRAEPTAVFYWDSSDDEDEVGEIGNATPITEKKSIASPKATAKNSLVVQNEHATRPSPRKPGIFAVGNKEVLDRKGKGKAVERDPLSPPSGLMLLDEMMATLPLAKPIASTSKTTSRSPPSTPPRPKRTPFNVLTPENTFGASSPFKTRPSSGMGKSLFQTHRKDKENSDGSYNYGSIPGGFDDVNLYTLFETPQDTTVIFDDTRGFFTSLFLFILGIVLEGLAYYVIWFRLQDGWAGVSL